MHPEHDTRPGWADRPEVQQRIRYLLYVICALLVLADLVVDRYTYLPVEEMPAFYAFYGFAALVGVVAMAKILRSWVGRREGYYEEERDDVA